MYVRRLVLWVGTRWCRHWSGRECTKSERIAILNWGSREKVSVQFNHSVMSDCLRPHGLQHARPPCPSLTPGVYSDSCPLSRWCHPNHLILCHPLLLLPSIFPSIRVFSNESVLHLRWPKSWSFSISPWGLISFRMDWFDFLAVQRGEKCIRRTCRRLAIKKHKYIKIISLMDGTRAYACAHTHTHTHKSHLITTI